MRRTRVSARGPGAFFRDHPGAFVASLAGALGTAAYAAVGARRADEGRAVRWWALAALTTAQAVGIASARRRARQNRAPSR